jgi:ubiquinone biosynthesis protein
VILISSKGQRVAKELEKLQDQVSGFSFQQVQEVVEMELGEKLENIFEEFNEKPLASASIRPSTSSCFANGRTGCG